MPSHCAQVAGLVITVGFLLFLGSWSIFDAGQAGPCRKLWRRKMRRHDQLMALRTSIVEAELSGSTSNFFNHSVYDPFEPTYTCHSEHRRGKAFGDGGKFVCGGAGDLKSRLAVFPKAKKCLVYSVGSNGEVSFERDVVKTLGCRVVTFDPTGPSEEYKERVEAVGGTFHAIGVSGSPSTFKNSATKQKVKLLPIKDIMLMLGHVRRHVHILKIDCEGCEWGVFATLWPQLEDGQVSIGQIQIEIHGTEFAKIASFFKGADRAGFMVFHKEANPLCEGYKCFEYSLIHKNDAKRIFESAHFCKAEGS